MGIDVYTLYIEYPDAIIQVKVGDLVEAARQFAKDLESLKESTRKDRNLPDTLFTKREVMDLLGISETTLWRWHTKYDYLHPIMVGSERRWSRKDISAIIEGKVKDYAGNPVWTVGKSNISCKERK